MLSLWQPTLRIETEPQAKPPSYPDFRPYWPHPWIPAGINDAPMACDEVNGRGINWPRSPDIWDDVLFSRPTVMTDANNFDPALPGEVGQTVDIWVLREKRTIFIQRDLDKVRAEGRRGHKTP